MKQLLIILVLLLSQASLAQSKTVFYEGIKITATLEGVTARQDNKVLWTHEHANIYYPQTLRIAASFVVVSSLLNTPAGLISFIIDAKTGRDVTNTGGDFLIQEGDFLYLEDYSWSEYILPPTFYDIDLARFDTRALQLGRMKVVIRGDTPSLEKCSTPGETYKFSFVRKEGDVWVFHTQTKKCVVKVTFIEKALQPNISVSAK